MPKISDEKRAARKTQILEAAWSCFQREGLHATTMDDIIKASGLSAGAVYSYFPSKEELILTAVETSLSGLAALVAPLLQAEPALAPTPLAREIAATVDRFAARDGFDLKRVALLGWSEAQRNGRLKTTMETFYRGFRDQLAAAIDRWSRSAVGAMHDTPDGIARTLLSLILGYVVQAAIIGDITPDDIVLDIAPATTGGR